MNDTPFTTHGDEALEARIVSWVLGEASAFEAAELERLCEERPELMVFKRRMRALHGLLTEAEKQQPDEGWKLPEDKRRALDELFGEPAVVRLEAERERRVKHSGRRALLAIAACVVLTLVVLSLLPGEYEAAATIEIKPRSSGMSPLGMMMAEAPGANRMSPQFFATEFDKIKSRNNLEQVVENLELTSRWGVDKETALKRLKDRIETKNIRGTDLVEIRAREKDPNLAKDIAGEVTKNYQVYRREIEQREAERQLAELDKAVRDQEDKVEERRKVLATIVRTKGIVYRGQSGADEDGDDKKEAIKKGLDAQDYVDARREFENDQEFLQQLKLKKTGEEISLRMPRETVEVHKEPVVSAPSNPVRAVAEKLGGFFAGKDTAVASAERASKTESLPAARGMIEDGRIVAAKSGERMRSLQTTIPRELIEGTPKPMNVPNLEMPVNGPAGSSSWSAASRGAAAPADGGVVASRASAETAPAPAAPAAPPAVVIAGKTGTSTVVPVPEQTLQDASLAFGGGTASQSVVPGEVRYKNDLADSKADGMDSDHFGTSDVEADALAQAAPAGKPSDSNGRAEHKERQSKDASSDPIRSNAALTYEHQQKVDEVRRDLYKAEGNYNLGKFDEAKREYENVLRTDPSNQAARRGLEKLAEAKSDYYRAAYDHTRAELLAEVDKSWELAVPAEKAKDADESKVEAFYADSSVLKANANATDEKSWSGLAQRELIRRKTNAEAEGLRKQIEDPAIADSKKQSIFKEWNEKQKALAALDGEKPGKTDLELATGEKAESSLRVSEASITKVSDAQPSPVDLMQEVSCAEEPFSTFSLNISDASFQVAQAALAKGERPDPAGVKVEQFYNAVDYGDPAPANGEPVAVSIGQVAHPVIPGRNLVRIALKTAAAGRSAAQPLRLTLLVDQSGSMSREDRRAAMDKALAGLGGLLTGSDLVTVIGFSRTPRLLADGLTGDKANTLPQLVNQSASEGGTNLEQAIDLAAQLSERRKQAGAQNRIVLFTDGAANLGNADPEKLAARVRELRQKGIAFDIAGIVADGLNDELLGELARNGNGRYYVVGKGGEETFAKQLAGAFRPAAENVKVQVRFNPERVARYKLIGFEKDRLKTEDFRNDAVDAAELAAEEAGVAIYQVEPVPNGRGEIGEVSVRFRDTAAAAMVERSWTVSYDADAPAIDRAPPSMQLATLAMLAAEKLKGGPLAEAIDFKQLTTPAANVKQHYGNHGRPAEVLRMVDSLK
jgi:uncharacterized protein involved in exopolysaccharide biosynthesis